MIFSRTERDDFDDFWYRLYSNSIFPFSNDGSPSVCALRDIYILQKNKSKIKLQKVLINVLQQLNAQSGEKIL
jgi:hypothetical protein